MGKRKTALNLRVVLQEGVDGYIVAECLDIPGCISQGKTEAEALKNIADAAEVCLSVMLEDYLKAQSKRRSGHVTGKPGTLRVAAPSIEAVAV